MKLGPPSADWTSSWGMFLLLAFLCSTETESSSSRRRSPPRLCVRPVTARSQISVQLLASSPKSSISSHVEGIADDDPIGVHDGAYTIEVDYRDYGIENWQQQHRMEDLGLPTILRQRSSPVNILSSISYPPLTATHRSSGDSPFLRGTIAKKKNERMTTRVLDKEALVAELLRHSASDVLDTNSCWEPVAFNTHIHSKLTEPMVQLNCSVLPQDANSTAVPKGFTTTNKKIIRNLSSNQKSFQKTDPSFPITLPSTHHLPESSSSSSQQQNASIPRILVVASDDLLRYLELLETLIVAASTHPTHRSIHMPETIGRFIDSMRAWRAVQPPPSQLQPPIESRREGSKKNGIAITTATTTTAAVDRTATTDLSGTWRPILTKDFYDEYDIFLQACGESYWVRKLILNALSMHTLIVRQLEDGNGEMDLEMIDMTPLGSWNRTLKSSSSSKCSPSSPSPRLITDIHQHSFDLTGYASTNQNDEEGGVYVNHLIDPQGDPLQVVAYWCDGATVHKSIMKSHRSKIRHGLFESNRYLLTDPSDGGSSDSPNDQGTILVCESIYYPPPTSRENDVDGGNVFPVTVVWKFRKQEVLGTAG